MLNIQENKFNLPNAELPQPPYQIIYNKQISCADKLDKIQAYISRLQYNHTGLDNITILRTNTY